MTAEIVTFGCRLNTYESEVMRAHAAAQGLEQAVIVNTCAVTAEAVRQARQTIRRLKRERPEARIIVTGCAAQTEPATFAAMPEVDRVLGNAEKMKPESFAPDFGADATLRVRVNDIMSVRETAAHMVKAFDGRARAFVQVQNGCDHRCTFCIIPFGRGNSRSVPAGSVVEEVRGLVSAGYAEVVLTGVDITAWGLDLPGTPRLGDLCQRILKLVPELPRLRLSSIDSVEADATLMRLIAGDARLMPHLHLSLQAGDDMILKRMKRRHSRADSVRFCETVRRLRPDVAFGADLIAGFPTETDAMFENTRALVEDCGLSYLHVFPFSPRNGTPAARMPQLPKDVIRARAEALRAAGRAALSRRLASRVGTATIAHAETATSARTPCFAPVSLASPVTPGALVPVRITGATPDTLLAEAA